MINEEYKHLIWWLFPSEVLPQILKINLGQHATFDHLVEANDKEFGNLGQLEFHTPFIPRDYNKREFEYAAS